MTSRVRVIDQESLVWPRKCACCGCATETTTEVTFVREVGHGGSIVYQHSVPACTACAEHRRLVDPERGTLLFGCF
jgi:hypothetical protein